MKTECQLIVILFASLAVWPLDARSDDSPSGGSTPPAFEPESHWHIQPMLRRDWTDVTASEDPTQDYTTAGNIQGATFSYSRDASANNSVKETWTADGAAILAFVYKPDLASGFQLVKAAIAPSVTIDKIGSNIPTNDVDHLYYRLGGSALISYMPGTTYAESDYVLRLQMSAAFVYDTDTGHHASLPGAEFDIEPQVLLPTSSSTLPWLGLGFQNRVGASNTNLYALFQMRAWLHGEGGDIQQNGAKWNVIDGSFFRLGPAVRAQIALPRLKDLSLSAEYDYLPTISGKSGRNDLYKLGAAFPLYQTADKAKKISLTADYTKGGLILSKQAVDIFTIGLSVTL
jgi:hypothetical protein